MKSKKETIANSSPNELEKKLAEVTFELERKNRDLEIEAALERVRTVAMGMSNPDDLLGICETMFHELKKLGFDDLRNAMISIHYDEKQYLLNYEYRESVGKTVIRVIYNSHPIVNNLVDHAKQSSEGFTEQVYAGEALDEWRAFRMGNGEADDPHLYNIGALYYYFYSIGTGAVGISMFSAANPGQLEVLKRFRNVFDLAYKRYIDITNAGAQAREAQIELALERVRARTMAMQKSDELKEIIKLVYEQLVHLNIPVEHAGFIMDYNTRDDMHIWLADKHYAPSEITVPYFDSPHWNGFNDAKQKGSNFFAIYSGFEEKNRFYQDLFKLIPGVTEETKEYYFSCPGLAISTVLLENVGLYIENFAGTPYSDDENGTLMRFGKVFQQTYTRFLDLQKAEAQVREAQIEAALEKVRSRSLAMHQTEELREVVTVVFDKLHDLGIVMEEEAASIVIFTEGTKDLILWNAIPDQLYSKSFHIPYYDTAVIKSLVDAKSEGADFFKRNYTPEEKDHFWKWAVEYSDYKNIPDDRKKHILERKYFACSVAYTKNSAILVSSYNGKLLSEKESEILKRFARVFEQAYVRFLDLHKAEEQAREAQIQLALERVRARTMAMQKSDELAETVSLLFRQLLGLGIRTEQIRTCGIVTFDDKKPIGEQWITETNGEIIPQSFMVPYDEAPAYKSIYKAWKHGEQFMVIHLEGNALKEHLSFLAKDTNVPTRDVVLPQQAKEIFNHVMYFSQGCLFIITKEALPEYHDVFKRFGAVFQQSYTRFLDLQKAEAQAREAQIEAALERVRSRTMAMQKSDELAEVIQVVHDQLHQLNFNIDVANFVLNYTERDDFDLWLAVYGQQYATKIHVPYFDHPIFNRFNEAKEKGLNFFADSFTFEEKNIFFKHFFENTPGIPEERKAVVFDAAGYARSTVFLKNIALSIQNYAAVPYSDTENAMVMRFGKVFEQTYTRFNDLKQAEEQAREAKIEAALERVRSRTMAMHSSKDVADTVATMFDELVKLGIDKTIRSGIGILDDTAYMEVWTASSAPNGDVALMMGRLDTTIHPLLQGVHKAWKNKELRFTYELAGSDQKDYITVVNNSPDYPVHFDFESLPSHQFNNCFFFPEGTIFVFSQEQLTTEATQIFKRFAGVFGQTYRRYLDLQKAEAQAREAKIEASLERVRSKAMAMRSSEDLADAIGVFYHELGLLSVTPRRCGLGLIDKETRLVELSTMNTIDQGNSIEIIGELKLAGHPVLEGIYDNWLRQEEYHPVLHGNDIKAYYQVIQSQISYPDYPDDAVQYGYYFFFRDGGIFAWTETELPEAEVQIYRRFNSVISLTYRRYKDIREAEAQAREAQIEAALERVRGRTMAMQKSEELKEVIQLVYEQLKQLNFNIDTANFNLNFRESNDFNGWIASPVQVYPKQVHTPYLNHPLFNNTIEAKENGRDFMAINLSCEEKNTFMDHFFKNASEITEERKKYVFDSAGYTLSMILMKTVAFSIANYSGIPYLETENAVLTRFGKVFEQTYTRFLDLQRAEAQIREATKQASLDRLRAEIASMRTTGDLERITPLIWNELTILGVPFIRCGVFIMDEQLQHIHTYLSTPDGKAIASFQLPFNDNSGNGVSRAALLGWRQKKGVTLHWTEEEFKTFSHRLVERGEIISEESYLTERPATGLDLHFFPFLQGMLYAGNTAPLSDDDKDLAQSLADAFSTAYARYEDFNSLELAKQEVENTLTDLKSAQTKLIQSEKMASLGELTAGIAHEIQNPLNFVNNFSEVNQEMIDEMEEELNAGNIEEALAIASDIKQNEQKINHHGKRADAIVKGMLQHSRTAGGEKLPTNINSVAEEYMRLSYHGLRAKDKAFNAEMVMHFDPELPRVEAVGQDIGRVFLNLFNNAFYAVNQKSKTAGADYKPEVSLTTSTEKGQVVIKVTDNGIGIPNAIKDKIMQPFFTTKPTGEGTGLGLSLTYDMVVKGHGGVINMNSKEGEGSEFIITLPLKRD